MDNQKPEFFSDEYLESKKEIHEELFEEYCDQIFGYESKIDGDVWINAVIEKQSYIFRPEEARKKIFDEPEALAYFGNPEIC